MSLGGPGLAGVFRSEGEFIAKAGAIQNTGGTAAFENLARADGSHLQCS